MHKIRLYGLVALPLAFGLAACSTSGDPEVSATPSAADTAGVTVAVDTSSAANPARDTRDMANRPADTVAANQPAGIVAQAPTDTLAAARDTSALAQDTSMARDTSVSGYQASGAGASQTLQVVAQNNSGYSGNVVLTDLGGNRTRIAFTLNAPDSVANKEVDHDSHVHTGTCAAPGPVVHPLEDVRGNGQASESEVPMGVAALQDGNHIIEAHEDNGTRPIACAEIKKSGM